MIPSKTTALIVPKSKIVANGDFNLSGERYQAAFANEAHFPFVRLGEIAELIRGITFGKPDQLDSPTSDSLAVATTKAAQTSGIVDRDLYYIPRKLLKDETKLLRRGDILISTANSLNLLGRTTHITKVEQPISFGAFMSLIRPGQQILDGYLIHCLRTPYAYDFFLRNANTTTNISNLNLSSLAELEIPLPPLEIQQEIVTEIEGYQKVINGARAVLDNYRPHIPIQPEWPMVKLDAISTIVRGSSPRPQGDPKLFGGPVPRLMVADITRDGMYTTPKIDSLTIEGATKSRPMKQGDVVIAVSGNPGLPTILAIDACIHDGFVGLRELHPDAMPQFVYFALLGLHGSHGSQSVGAVFKNLTSDQIREFDIPLPRLATQQAIVAEIEAEQALVAANRELITRFERKIQATLARIWGDGEAGSLRE